MRETERRRALPRPGRPTPPASLRCAGRERCGRCRLPSGTLRHCRNQRRVEAPWSESWTWIRQTPISGFLPYGNGILGNQEPRFAWRRKCHSASGTYKLQMTGETQRWRGVFAFGEWLWHQVHARTGSPGGESAARQAAPTDCRWPGKPSVGGAYLLSASGFGIRCMREQVRLAAKVPLGKRHLLGAGAIEDNRSTQVPGCRGG